MDKIDHFDLTTFIPEAVVKLEALMFCEPGWPGVRPCQACPDLSRGWRTCRPPPPHASRTGTPWMCHRPEAAAANVVD